MHTSDGLTQDRLRATWNKELLTWAEGARKCFDHPFLLLILVISQVFGEIWAWIGCVWHGLDGNWVKKEKGSEKLPKLCTLVSLKAEVIDDKINKDVATCFCSDVSRFEWEKPGGKHERKRDR